MSVTYYRYKGNWYVYLDHIQVKDPVTRQWEIHVLYADTNGHRYARLNTEFYERFAQDDPPVEVLRQAAECYSKLLTKTPASDTAE